MVYVKSDKSPERKVDPLKRQIERARKSRVLLILRRLGLASAFDSALKAADKREERLEDRGRRLQQRAVQLRAAKAALAELRGQKRALNATVTKLRRQESALKDRVSQAKLDARETQEVVERLSDEASLFRALSTGVSLERAVVDVARSFISAKRRVDIRSVVYSLSSGRIAGPAGQSAVSI